GRVETGFDLRVALRLDVRIAELQRGELPELTPDHLSAVDYVARSKQGRVAGLTPGRAQLHLVDAGERLHEPVGRCRFREEVELPRVAVHARAVGADAVAQQQSLVRQLAFFLAVDPHVLHGLLGL